MLRMDGGVGCCVVMGVLMRGWLLHEQEVLMQSLVRVSKQEVRGPIEGPQQAARSVQSARRLHCPGHRLVRNRQEEAQLSPVTFFICSDWSLSTNINAISQKLTMWILNNNLYIISKSHLG